MGGVLARINIEDSLFRDKRFSDLCIKCGSRALALGHLVEVWLTAQQTFLKHGEIPNHEWIAQGLNEDVVSTGLAERTPTGVRVVGQEKHFAWLVGRSKAGAVGGGRSAEVRKIKYGTTRPLVAKREAVASQNVKHPRSTAKHSEANGSKTKQTEANASTVKQTEASSSYSYSSSSSSSDSHSDSHSEEEAKKQGTNASHSTPAVLASGQISQRLVAKFCEEYKRRYVVQYRVTGKDVGILKRLREGLGSDALYDRIVTAYLDMPDSWFINKRHDVTTLEANLAKVSQFEQTGKMVTQNEIREIDRKLTVRSQLEKIERGEI